MPDILIIDDEAPIREIMRRTLEGSGYAVREAADGEAGLEAVRQRAPDLVISDLIMPEREGLETIQVLREEFPGVKILAVSGGGGVAHEGYLMDAELFGADASLAKPFSLTDLCETVARLLAIAGSPPARK